MNAVMDTVMDAAMDAEPRDHSAGDDPIGPVRPDAASPVWLRVSLLTEDSVEFAANTWTSSFIGTATTVMTE